MSKRKKASAITTFQVVLPRLLFFRKSAADIQTKNALHPVIDNIKQLHFNHQYKQNCLQTFFGETNHCFTTLCATESRRKTQSNNLYL